MPWNTLPEPPQELIDQLIEKLSVSPVVARLLARLGFDDPDQADEFLNCSINRLDDPSRISHLDDAVGRISRAIDQRQDILVFGDYDVDGVTAVALFVLVLRHLGARPRYAVPRRLSEGYGLSHEALDRVLKDGNPDLFVTLDCGTNSVDQIARLRKLGIDVIIADHHRSKEGREADATIVNPHVYDGENEPWTHLCAVGLAFKLAHGLRRLRRAQGDPNAQSLRLVDLLDLVAMGTIADLVPMRRENRIYTRFGLQMLGQRKRAGIHALLESCNISAGQPLNPTDVSFRLSPRINASGRLDDASIAVELLLSSDGQQCAELANQLNEFNKERQEKERLVTQDALRMIEEGGFSSDPAFVLYGEHWHPGVVGIVAGKLSRQFGRPCVVLGKEGDALAKGSGRGVHSLNLIDILTHCKDLLQNWGGHPMAVGVSLHCKDIDTFRARLIETMHRECGGLEHTDEVPVDISVWLPVEQINQELLEDIETLSPFGEGNPEPVFGVRAVQLPFPPEVFGEGNYRFYLPAAQQRRGLCVVAWRKAAKLPPASQPIDIALRIFCNFYNGRQYAQAELIDWRPCG